MKILCCFLLCLAAPAQRLYNEAQDLRAKDAVAASALIRDSSVFEKALANLTEVQRLQQENILLGAKLQTRADVNSWHDWNAVRETAERVRSESDSGALSPGEMSKWKKALEDVAKRHQEVNDSLEALKKKIAASNPDGDVQAVGAMLAQIGRLKPVADFLLKLAENGNPAKSDLDAATQSAKTLGDLAEMYKKFSTGIPDRPSVIFLNYQLQLLEGDEMHYKNLIAIRERRSAEIASIAKLSGRVVRAIESQSLRGDVVDSLRAQAARVKAASDEDKPKLRERLDIMLTALLDASAVAARGHLPSDLAAQRESLELRAHTLRRSRLAASVYEELLANGAQRLAAYYKGGIRPRNLAELIHAMTSAGLIPAVLNSK